MKIEGIAYIVSLLKVIAVSGDATVTISHRYTPKEQLCQHTKIADIIVAAAGLCHCLFSCIGLYFNSLSLVFLE